MHKIKALIDIKMHQKVQALTAAEKIVLNSEPPKPDRLNKENSNALSFNFFFLRLLLFWGPAYDS